MKSEVEVEELLVVLEKIRAEQLHDIPAALLRDIVLAEYENQDDPVEGRRNAKKAIDTFLRETVIEQEV